MYNARLFLDLFLAVVALATPLFGSASEHKAVGLVAFIAPTLPERAVVMPRMVKNKTMVPRSLTYTVTATVYEAVQSQTDDEPLVTADNSRIKPHYGSQKRWMALSRDLLKRWGGDFDYGDTVRVTGISSKLDGVYTIHDTMNRRFRHCIDLLVHPSENIAISTKGVKIQKVAYN